MAYAEGALFPPRGVIDVLYEDDDILIVDKPAGMIVHPAPGRVEPALTAELQKRFPDIAGVGSVERPGVVHRLDIETSGVMVFARNRAAYLALRREFEKHERVRKTYLAVVHGSPKMEVGTLDGPVGRDRLRAITHWTVLAKRGPVSLVEFRIETGRMHQIRIHAAELGCPIVGDRIYGNAAKDRSLRHRPRRQLLHAVELAFPHPRTGKKVCFSSVPPSDIVYAC